jgi:hypothetical protein
MWEMSFSPALKVFQLHCSRASKDWKHSCNQDSQLQNLKVFWDHVCENIHFYWIFYSTHIISVTIEISSIMVAQSKDSKWQYISWNMSNKRIFLLILCSTKYSTRSMNGINTNRNVENLENQQVLMWFCIFKEQAKIWKGCSSIQQYYIWASCCIDVSHTHSPPSLMQFKTVHNLSLI